MGNRFASQSTTTTTNHIDANPSISMGTSRSTIEVANELLATLAASSQPHNNNNVRASELMDELVISIEDITGLQTLNANIQASLQRLAGAPLRPPPASKQLVANLPVITITDEILSRLGSEASGCIVCRENLITYDKMQQLPCNHLFHPLCLKPWLDAHNSCPVCRYELPTDNQAYESRKKREKEAPEDRTSAANIN
ncbi:hypothetical protein GIB67_010509 [Kingdonia uniflora]|uniref:RING-type E3 ubiquitin transferase n=1 Tax=Kingdonia uniflora TaxID=39325 RepID=A0A7J7MAM1_9MAGN|nr:hypothetical protein GIB67_010509 [Kingdonia uniflora]